MEEIREQNGKIQENVSPTWMLKDVPKWLIPAAFFVLLLI